LENFDNFFYTDGYSNTIYQKQNLKIEDGFHIENQKIDISIQLLEQF